MYWEIIYLFSYLFKYLMDIYNVWDILLVLGIERRENELFLFLDSLGFSRWFK